MVSKMMWAACVRAALLLGVGIHLGAARADVSETVFTLSEDLRTASKYFSNRNDDIGDFSFRFPSTFNQGLITYARPANYRWESMVDEGEHYKVLRFPSTASYAYLQRITDRDEFLAVDDKNPSRYYLVVDGSACVGRSCMQDETIISVNLPARLKVISYVAKVDGEWLAPNSRDWKVVDTTYTFYRRDLKGASVTFYVEDPASAGFGRLSKSLAGNKDILVTNEGNKLRVVIPVENLFPSGSATISPKGLEWIKVLAGTLKDLSYLETRVEGHTDNQPISKKSVGIDSNWELSSMRATHVVQYLVAQGLPEGKLAAVGYADTHPIASNETPEGRAQNRRIEFSIVTQASEAPPSR